VILLYIAAAFTLIYLATLVWGYYKDISDSLRVIPIPKNEPIEQIKVDH